MSESSEQSSQPHPSATSKSGAAPSEAHAGTRRLARFWWALTTLICMIAGIVVLLRGDTGYGLVAFAVAASAAINLP